MKVLLVEDDKFFQKFYASKLKEQGFEVAVASNGNEGLEQAVSVKPAIIILDLIMPEKDGFEFLQAYKQDAKINKIPVLVFSTLGQDEDVKKAIQFGARDFVNKGQFDFDGLKTKIREIVEK